MCVCVQVIILIGNKADLEAQRDVTYEEAKQFAEENGEKCVCARVCVTLSDKHCVSVFSKSTFM